MQRLQRNGAGATNQMKAASAIYVPAIYDYNPHLIGCHQRHSAVDAKVWLARRADNGYFQHNSPQERPWCRLKD